MRKFLTLFASVLLAASAWAATVTIDFSQQGYANAQEVTTLTVSGVTVTFDKGTNSTTPKYYTTGTGVRVYGSNTITVSASENINQIDFTFSGSSYNFAHGTTGSATADTGTYTEDGAAGSWTGGAGTVTITLPGGSGHARLQKMVVTTGGSAVVTTATPTFTPAAGTYYAPIEVSLKCATAGASIYYTTNGTAPTASSTLYSAPIALSSNTTIKAIAIANNVESEVATAEYVFGSATSVANIAAFLAVEDNTQVVFTNPVTVLKQNGKNMYVQDATGNALFYGTTGKTYKAGDVIPAGFTGTKIPYNGEYGLAVDANSNFQDGTAGTAVTPTQITVAQMSHNNFAHLVVINNATLGYTENASGSKTMSTITDASGEGSAHNGLGFNVNGFDYTKTYNVTGIVGAYKTASAENVTYQILPISVEEVGGGGSDTTTVEGLTIAEYQQVDDNTVVTIKNDVTTLAQSGNRLFVKDDTGYMLIYGSVGKTYAKGDVIPAGFSGKKTTYDGEPELANPFSGFQDKKGTVDVTAEEAKAAFFAHENFGHYVVVKNATINTTDGTITDADGNTLKYYNNMGASMPADLTQKYDVYGIVGSYGKTNTVYQLLTTDITLAGGGEVQIPQVANLDALYALDQGVTGEITGDVIAIYQNGNNLYVKSDNTFGLVYGHLTNTFTNGDVIVGAQGTWTTYNDAKQMTPVDESFVVNRHGDEVAPIETAIEEIGQDWVHTYVKLLDCTVTKDSVNGSGVAYYTINDGTAELVAFNRFGTEIPEELEGHTFNVIGFISLYKGLIQLYPVDGEYADEPAYADGDVNGDTKVDGTDLNILINIILGKDQADNYDGRANVDHQGGVDGNDLNALINILLGK
ncbi:MAG: chitobiase/beta-hexosaminidase C-terminal domain-containing protein [Muribaculaceae bacterium]|nr:chitobiase/beta-hexosaminidase C-terminal domain-containing protein [Muribaculaceae bacterium]